MTIFSPEIYELNKCFVTEMAMVESLLPYLEEVDEPEEPSMFEEVITEAFGKKAKEKEAKAQAEADAARRKSIHDQPENVAARAAGRAMQDARNTRPQDAPQQASSGIKKAIDALCELVRKIREGIEDFFAKRKMEKAEREAYEAFKAACRKNPEFRNTKITVKDYKKFIGQYNQMNKEVHDELMQIKKDQSHPIERLTNKVKDFTKSTIGEASMVVTAESLLNAATVNTAGAKEILNAVRQNEAFMNEMRKQMGDKNFVKWNKNMKRQTQWWNPMRYWVNFTGRKFDDYVSAVVGPFQTIKNLAEKVVGGDVAGIAKDIATDTKTRSMLKTAGRTEHLGAPLDAIGGYSGLAKSTIGAGRKKLSNLAKKTVGKDEDERWININFPWRKKSAKEGFKTPTFMDRRMAKKYAKEERKNAKLRQADAAARKANKKPRSSAGGGTSVLS